MIYESMYFIVKLGNCNVCYSNKIYYITLNGLGDLQTYVNVLSYFQYIYENKTDNNN